MSLIYGYSDKKDNGKNGGGNVSDLKKLVGKKTDDRTVDTAIGKIQNNQKNIQTKSTLLGSKADSRSVDSAFGRIKGNKKDIQTSISSTVNVVASVVASLGQKTDAKTKDTAFGRIKENKEDILNTTISTSNVVASVALSLGSKTDPKTKDTAFGRIRRNEESIGNSNNLVGFSSSVEGESNIKGVQLSHASAISAHSNNLLDLESNLGLKTDSKTVDSAFGRIQKIKENIEKLKPSTVKLKEVTGSFIAPLNDKEKADIAGWWAMPRDSTIIAITIKARQALTGVSRVKIYSGTSWDNANHIMTVPMSLADMKLGRPAVVVHTWSPAHGSLFANTRGNAVGSILERAVEVKFTYIDHTT